MKATVVVSCYNQETYIAECLESIVQQETECDFKILVADDASTDNTQKIIQQFKSQYPEKIECILREKNLGPAGNYIDAHTRAQGDIIFHIDGDDVMIPGKIQQQWKIFTQNPEVNLVFHRAQYFSDDGTYVSDTRSPCYEDEATWFFDAEDLATWGTITVHSAYAYRKSARKIYNPGRDFMEWFFAMDALLPEGKGAYINKILVKYRCNPNGNSYLSSRNGKIKAYQIYFKDVWFYANAFPQLRKKLFTNVLVTQLGMLRNRCGVDWGAVWYLCSRWFYFRVGLLRTTLKVRNRIAPERRVS